MSYRAQVCECTGSSYQRLTCPGYSLQASGFGPGLTSRLAGMLPLVGPEPQVWNELAEVAGNIFASHAWNECWWRFFGEGGTPHVLCDDVEKPRLLLPLYSRGRALRQVRFLGHGPADQLGPVCAPQDAHLALPLLQEALATGALPADVVLLQDMSERETWWEPLAGRRVSREASPTLRFKQPLSWEQYLASKSKNFRAQANRKPRQLESRYNVTFRLSTADTLQRDLDQLFALHGRRWDGASPLLEERQQSFTRDFAATALLHGWLRLRVLELDARPVAALLGFRFGAADYYYQLGRDPDQAGGSVGFVLLVHAVREALETGAAEFRLLRGDEEYKERFASSPGGIETIAIPTSARGHLAVSAAAARRRLRG